jgi:ApaG protein
MPATRVEDGPDSYSATTRGVRVTVSPRFMAERSDPEQGRFFWAYGVTIENLGAETVTLVSRHWRITDALNRLEEVHGPGVVGEQPVLQPGDSFEYTSGCPLETPSGAMQGSYQMITASGESFDAEIPAFSLHLPGAARRLN